MVKTGSFENLAGWQKARELTRAIYQLTSQKTFVGDTGLREQMRQASVLVMSHIAEGFERGNEIEFCRSLTTARGLIGTIKAQLYVALDTGFIDHFQFTRLYHLATETAGLIDELMEYPDVVSQNAPSGELIISDPKELSSSLPVTCLGMAFESDEARREYFLERLREGLEELHARLGGVPFTTVEDAVARMKSVEKWPMGDEDHLRELAERMSRDDFIDLILCGHAEDHLRELAGRMSQAYSSKDLLQRWKDEVGFPYGSIEDILNLSDPPYYTACPNPFVQDFIEHYGRPYDPETDDYRREPYAVDIQAGKRHPIYTAHPYHSKIPHLAIMPCILYYTEPGDVVLGVFSKSGMTGVAAQLCGRPEPDFKDQLEAEWKEIGLPAPRWGTRVPVLVDLSPVANFIAYNLNCDIDVKQFEQAAEAFFEKIESELGWMYETRHTDGRTTGRINYVVWSEVFTCPECMGEVVFIEQAYNPETGKFAKEFACPDCGAKLTTRSAEHKFTTVFDKATGKTVRKVVYVPVEIEYTIPGDKTKYRKPLDEFDKELLKRLEAELPGDWFPTYPLPLKGMLHSSGLGSKGVTHFHHFYLPRALHALSTMWRIANEWSDTRVRGFLKFMVEQAFWTMSMLNRYRPGGYSMVNQYISGMFYIPSAISELSPWYIYQGKYRRLLKMVQAQLLPQSRSFIISTASSLHLPLQDNSIDYIYMDPPFGDFLSTGELDMLVESWHRVFTNLCAEVLIGRNKSTLIYESMMSQVCKECYRALKPGRWMTLVFQHSKTSVWHAIQEALQAAGFVIADVRTLDKKQFTFHQVTKSAPRGALFISCYKPDYDFEERFKLEAGTEEGVWDFVRTHLRKLPVVEKDGQLEVVAERQNYLLFDRMVAFHVQRGVTVPLSAAEFYAGLEQRFLEREGMYFLPEQVEEYDRKRMKVKEVRQFEFFVTDEASAIQWLKQQLERKPQTFQELRPKFRKEIAGWQKHEKPLELSELLEQNFLRYDGNGPIPPQIVSWMKQSAELHRIIREELEAGWAHEDTQGLHTSHPELLRRARERWYVPDPNKARDLEKLRERALLREFEEYRESKQRRLKVFRLEAVRAGFKKAWQERDYATIIAVARKIPEHVLQEDSKLLMWYDQARTKLEEI